MGLYEIYKNNKLPEIWQKKTKEFVKPGKSEKEKDFMAGWFIAQNYEAIKKDLGFSKG